MINSLKTKKPLLVSFLRLEIVDIYLFFKMREMIIICKC